MNSRSAHRGFTLVEAMVTIAILGILASIALPAFNDFISSRRVVGIAEALQTDLAYARSEAVQRNAQVSIAFGTDCYVVYLTAGTTASCTSVSPAANEIKRVAMTSSEGIGLTSSVATVTFSPERGDTDLGGNTATMEVKKGAQAVNVLLSRTGRSRICKPSGSSVGGFPDC
jgi:type IV fimbrial biogenesis protein FimT